MLQVVNFLSQKYAMASMRWPHAIAGATSTIVLTSADLVCQTFVQPNENLDLRRTLSLSCFGAIWYGGPCKFLYLRLDKMFGSKPTFMNAATKTFIDVYIHTPFALVPCFYFITNTVKGISLLETREQLQKEWATASFGSILFWTPMQAANFYFIPQTFKVPFISCFSFCHKLWLSYLANRERYNQQTLIQGTGSGTLLQANLAISSTVPTLEREVSSIVHAPVPIAAIE
mmetsp:Transcript_19650/g.25448  ORF Transcript_19650/g.25448 Transcript_19650/m.25448 type:complete len:230 (+) Transcript_19650:60-749(+)